ncbi:MFS transporter, partial [Penicillium malachiteum]
SQVMKLWRMIKVQSVGNANKPIHNAKKDAALAVVGDFAYKIDLAILGSYFTLGHYLCFCDICPEITIVGWFTIIGRAINYSFGQITASTLTPWQYIYIFASALIFLFIKEAFTDPKIYLVAIIIASAYAINRAISGFGLLIVATFSYNTLDSILF